MRINTHRSRERYFYRQQTPGNFIVSVHARWYSRHLLIKRPTSSKILPFYYIIKLTDGEIKDRRSVVGPKLTFRYGDGDHIAAPTAGKCSTGHQAEPVHPRAHVLEDCPSRDLPSYDVRETYPHHVPEVFNSKSGGQSKWVKAKASCPDKLENAMLPRVALFVCLVGWFLNVLVNN